MNSPKTITVANVNNALEEGLWWLRTAGVPANSRNGRVLRSPGPVITAYTNPRQRVLWARERDANPFFHLMESIWMLAGRHDVEFLEPFNSNMANYAEPNGVIHGAYGYRWTEWFEVDQLEGIVAELTRDPQSRQAVLAMWCARADLGNHERKDRPCNTHAYFEIVNNALQMTVCCRSNDIIWGAYGANYVHFGFLQEVLAGALGVSVGTYYQFSNNYHIYLNEKTEKLLEYPPCAADQDRYKYSTEISIPLFQGSLAQTVAACREFCDGGVPASNDFLFYIADHLREFYLQRKEGRHNMQILNVMPECDWKHAAIDWVNRHDSK